MGKIFYMMGKSSSGKDTIYKKIQEALPELKTFVLYTTRPIREGEQDGVEYHFVNEETCAQFLREGKIIELRAYDTIHGVWKYFTVDDGQINLEQSSYLAIGTLESYGQMKAYYPREAVIPVYIEVEDGERLQRALDREKEQETPRYAELCRRFLADTADFSEENLNKMDISRRFENRSIDQCASEILLYIRGEL